MCKTFVIFSMPSPPVLSTKKRESFKNPSSYYFQPMRSKTFLWCVVLYYMWILPASAMWNSFNCGHEYSVANP